MGAGEGKEAGKGKGWGGGGWGEKSMQHMALSYKHFPDLTDLNWSKSLREKGENKYVNKRGRKMTMTQVGT